VIDTQVSENVHIKTSLHIFDLKLILKKYMQEIGQHDAVTKAKNHRLF